MDLEPRKCDIEEFAKICKNPCGNEFVDAAVEDQSMPQCPEESRYYYRRLLFYIARAIEPTTYVEIGVWRGITTRCVMEGSPNTKCIGIDSEAAGARPNMLEGDDRFGYIHGNSTSYNTASTIYQHSDSVELMLIDGMHSYQIVEKEIDMYKEFWRSNTVVCFDDTDKNQILKVVEKYPWRWMRNFKGIGGDSTGNFAVCIV